jgi:hypothetical protein
MSIKQFELLHGAVILKICRNDRPVALTLIESDNARSTYIVNDVYVYVKHSTTPKSRQRSDKTVWQFTFSPAHIGDIATLLQQRDLYLALVCANENLNEEMEVAFLYSNGVQESLDFSYRTSVACI